MADNDKPLWERMVESETSSEETLETIQEVAKEEVKGEEIKKRGRPPLEKKVEEKQIEEPSIEEETNIEEEPLNEAESFYKEYTNLTGDNIEEIDFGNIDPLTPQGVAKLVEHNKVKMQSEIEEMFSKNAPIEYQALLMRLEGKDPSILYDKTGFIDYSKIEVSEENIDLQKTLIKEDMLKQGIPEQRVNKLIKSIENDGELFEESQRSKSNLADSQKKELEFEMKEARITKEKEQKEINDFSKVINDTVGKGEIGNFIIVEKDKKSFYDYVRNNIRYDDGSFIAATEINNDNYNNVMQSLFFQFKNGNLKDLVEKEAKKQNVNRLRTSAQATRIPAGDDITRHDSNKLKTGKSWKEELGIK